jgi:succinate dehydrogenase / fumarate reductase membrane anchor subunit
MVTRSAVADTHAMGSAREGAEHWKLQRLTAIANIPLVLWFIFSVVGLADEGYEHVRAWLSAPWNTILMVLFVVSTYWHARLGVQVILEDYVHGRVVKIASMVAVNLGFAALAGAALVAILKVSFGS